MDCNFQILLVALCVCHFSICIGQDQNWHGCKDNNELVEGETSRNGHEEKAINITINHLKNSDSPYSVAKDFSNYKGRSEVVDLIVKKAYTESVSLEKLAAFVVQLDNFELAYQATSALVGEMENRGQQRNLEILTIYYGVKSKASSYRYNKWHIVTLDKDLNTLSEKMKLLAEPILVALVDDISEEDFDQPLEACNMTNTAYRDRDYLNDIVTRYMAKGLAPFEHLFHFAQKLTQTGQQCTVLASMWEQLSKTGNADTFNALQVWLWARYIQDFCFYKGFPSPSISKCATITYEAEPPTHKKSFMFLYVESIRNKNFGQIKAWHNKYGYGMRVVLRDVVKELTIREMQDRTKVNILDAMHNLPWLEDVCQAAIEMRTKLEEFEMLGTFEHFRTLLLIKKPSNDSAYPQYYGKVRAEKCEFVKRNTPAVFQKLLEGETFDCRLINRKTSETLSVQPWESRRNVWSRLTHIVTDEKLPGQFWNISVDKEIGLVTLHNIDYAEHLRTAGLNSDWLKGLANWGKFRVQARDDQYLILESEQNWQSYVGVEETKASKDTQRYTKYVGSLSDHSTQWRLECKGQANPSFSVQ